MVLYLFFSEADQQSMRKEEKNPHRERLQRQQSKLKTEVKDTTKYPLTSINH
jgi:hypothetical protein